MPAKRENWKHHYYTVSRNARGQFVSWKKWKRSRPSTWVHPPKEVEEGKRYLVTVLSYTHETDVVQAWYIDLTKVTYAGVFTVDEQERYCLEYLSRAFTKALKEGEVVSENWGRDLPRSKYPPYEYTQDILDSKQKEFVSTIENEGKGPEEIIYLWRANSGNRLKAGLRHKV